MRVLFCKIHCPSFICFCKPTSHIYTPVPLKLENSPHVPSTTTTVVASLSDDHQLVCGVDNEETNQVKEESLVNGQKQQQQEQEQGEEECENCPRSSLKKLNSDSKQAQKKKVQWMDFLGKELVEIREFEASEIEDEDYDGEFRKGCVCTIL